MGSLSDILKDIFAKVTEKPPEGPPSDPLPPHPVEPEPEPLPPIKPPDNNRPDNKPPADTPAPEGENADKEETIDPVPFPHDPAKGQIIIDAGRHGSYGISTMTGPGWVANIQRGLINNNQHYVTYLKEDGSEQVTWSPVITQEGNYEVWVSYFATENRSTAVPFFVVDGNRKKHKFVLNQREVDTFGARFRMLGTFFFKKARAARTPRFNYVQCVNSGKGTSDSVDAALFRLVAKRDK